jgi:hypothetical protein
MGTDRRYREYIPEVWVKDFTCRREEFVIGKVFDNLSSEGLVREVWVKDFTCRREEFVIEALEQV